jgi:predicted  nucleic acid-binding Zn-ribbon protein
VKNMHLVATDDDGNKDKELEEALQSVKDQIVAKANQIKSEKEWVKEVTKIIEDYVKKTRRVNGNIRQTQKEVKILFRKKKQIENMILQRKLEKKLRVANDDLATLNGAMEGLQKKATAFTKSKVDIENTIGALETELKKLRGENPESSEASLLELQ